MLSWIVKGRVCDSEEFDPHAVGSGIIKFLFHKNGKGGMIKFLL